MNITQFMYAAFLAVLTCMFGFALLARYFYVQRSDAERHADDYKHQLKRQAIHHSIERDELRQCIQMLEDRNAAQASTIAALREQLGPNVVDLRNRSLDECVSHHPAGKQQAPQESRLAVVGEPDRVGAPCADGDAQ